MASGMFLSLSYVLAGLTILIVSERSIAEVRSANYFYSRSRTIGFSLLVDQIVDQPSGRTTYSRSLASKYGWNWKTWEAGAQATIASTIGNSATSTSVTAGPFIDWNMISNIPGNDLIPGIGGRASFGGKNDSGTAPNVQAIDSFQTGLFLKQFLSHSSACLRFDIIYV